MGTLKIIHSRAIFASKVVSVGDVVEGDGSMDELEIIHTANSKLIDKMLDQLEMLKPYVRHLESYYYVRLSSLPITEDQFLCTILYDIPEPLNNNKSMR
jgi:hypothetical protein